MKKRDFLKRSLALGAGALVSGPIVSAFAGTVNIHRDYSYRINNEEGLFKQPELDYTFDALEPYIDRLTMELHYGKHHAGYTNKLNAAVADEGLAGKSIEEIFASVSSYSDAVRNNGGGYYNHNLYWKFMSPKGGGEPKSRIGKAIDSNFGSFASFKEKFSAAAGSVFGSGWAWLIINSNGNLEVVTTPNQDNPLMNVSKVHGIPLLNIDVWEHAYYLKYQNRRVNYIEAYWNVINWDFVEELYLKGIS